MAGESTIHDIRRDKSKNRRLANMVLLLAGSFFLASGLYSVSVYVLSAMAGLDMVSVVSWEQSVSGPSWSFQREYTVYSEQACVLIPMVKEGERVSKGLEVARLNFAGEAILNEAANRRLYSQAAGIVSFETDGLELVSETRDYATLTVGGLEEKIGVVRPQQRDGQGLSGLIQDKITQESQENRENRDASEDREGRDDRAGQESRDGRDPDAQAAPGPVAVSGIPEPRTAYPKMYPADSQVMKITDNLSDCYLYLRLPDMEEVPFLETDTITMQAESGGTGRGTLLQCERIADGWGLLIRLESGLEIVRHGRQHELSLVLGTEERSAVPQGSVVMKDGELGVYVVEKNKARWQPVTVVDERDGRQIIEGAASGDIKPGDVVATRPWLIWDGMRLRG